MAFFPWKNWNSVISINDRNSSISSFISILPSKSSFFSTACIFSTPSRMGLHQFWKKYTLATASKLYDVEELIDYYFHRRLAAIVAVTISYLPFIITPNQITITGLILGLLSFLSLYHIAYPVSFLTEYLVSLGILAPFPSSNIIATSSDGFPIAMYESEMLYWSAIFLLAWIICDCADGQVARLCKRGTRTGRILDGIVDALVIAPNMFGIGWMTSYKYHTMNAMWFTTLAGLSVWIHAIVYDKIKNVYMAHAVEESECDGESILSVYEEYKESLEKNGWIHLDTLLLGFYCLYLNVQDTVVGCKSRNNAVPTPKNGKILEKNEEQILRDLYRKKYAPIARLVSYLGISTHITGLYISLLIARYYWFVIIYVQLYYIIILNIVLGIVIYQYYESGMSSYTQIRQEMKLEFEKTFSNTSEMKKVR